MIVLGGCGYAWSHTDHLIGGEPPQWLTLTPEQQAVERKKALANMRALGAHWRRTLAVGLALCVIGGVIVLLG